MRTRERKETLKQTGDVARELDPGWVRRDRLERVGLAIVGALAMGGLIVAIIAAVRSGDTAGQVRKIIQKTPCTVAPKSVKCTHVKHRIAVEGDIENPCIEHQRVTGLKGANCERFFIPPAERETGEPAAGPTASTSTAATAGPTAIAPTSATMPHAHPAPAHHHHGGGIRTPVPKAPPPAEPEPAGVPPPATSTAPSSGTEITTTVTPPAEGTSGTGATTNPSQGVLGTVGSSLGGTVEGVTGAAGTTVKETGEVLGGTVKGLTGETSVAP